MTTPIEAQGRYLNEIRRQPHWYCTLPKNSGEGRSWVVPRILCVVCGMFGCVDSDPENGGLTLLRNMCPLDTEDLMSSALSLMLS